MQSNSCVFVCVFVCKLRIRPVMRVCAFGIGNWRKRRARAPARLCVFVFALPKFINQKANASSKRNNIYLCICLFAFSHLHTHKVKFSLSLFACLFHSKGKRRVTRMVVVVVLAFAICWLPIHVSISLCQYIWYIFWYLINCCF